MRRNDICIYVSPASRARLEAIVADRNSPSKVDGARILCWRRLIALAQTRS
jgi:hypothetical protein